MRCQDSRRSELQSQQVILAPQGLKPQSERGVCCIDPPPGQVSTFENRKSQICVRSKLLQTCADHEFATKLRRQYLAIVAVLELPPNLSPNSLRTPAARIHIWHAVQGGRCSPMARMLIMDDAVRFGDDGRGNAPNMAMTQSPPWSWNVSCCGLQHVNKLSAAITRTFNGNEPHWTAE